MYYIFTHIIISSYRHKSISLLINTRTHTHALILPCPVHVHQSTHMRTRSMNIGIGIFRLRFSCPFLLCTVRAHFIVYIIVWLEPSLYSTSQIRSSFGAISQQSTGASCSMLRCIKLYLSTYVRGRAASVVSIAIFASSTQLNNLVISNYYSMILILTDFDDQCWIGTLQSKIRFLALNLFLRRLYFLSKLIASSENTF